MRLRASSLPIAVSLLLLASSAAAQTVEPRVRELAYDTRVDVAVTSVGAVWLMASELLKAQLVPEKCRWCYRAADGSDVLNPYDGWVRRKLLWEQTRTADVTSSILGFAIEPVSALGLTAIAAEHDGALGGFPVDALLIAEAAVIATEVNQVVKYAFARERPFVHYMPRASEGLRALTASPSDDNLSFFSGHTTLAFAVAASSGTVATMRGYRLAPVVWTSGMLMATSVGYLRMAADKHYFSDVMTGAVVGTVIGIGIPLLFHAPVSSRPEAVTAAPQAHGTAFSVGGAW